MGASSLIIILISFGVISGTSRVENTPLILTPYIEKGNVEEARNLSVVRGGPFSDDIISYSGFFTVNKTYNSNLFFWFFPSEINSKEVPIILWLQGGPGTSSLFGLFNEIGPYFLSEDDEVFKRNPYSWHKKYSLLFIDNPIGAGFSFTDTEDGLADNQTQVSEELYSALVQFFKLFPKLLELPFYIAGESYGGKHAAGLGHVIHKNNNEVNPTINLKGLSIGDGFMDPVIVFDNSHFLYHVGLIDNKAFQQIKEQEEIGKLFMEIGELQNAFNIWFNIFDLYIRNSGYSSVYNMLRTHDPKVVGKYFSFVQKDDVREAIHVGNIDFKSEYEVYNKIKSVYMETALPWLEELLAHYRVVYYIGQLDIILPYSSTLKVFNKMNFTAAEEYRNATRVPWYVDGELAGYMKSAGNFTEVLVRNAGHMVPMDQPKWAFDLIDRFIQNEMSRGIA